MILLFLHISNASSLIVDWMKSEWRVHKHYQYVTYHRDRELITVSEIERKVSKN